MVGGLNNSEAIESSLNRYYKNFLLFTILALLFIQVGAAQISINQNGGLTNGSYIKTKNTVLSWNLSSANGFSVINISNSNNYYLLDDKTIVALNLDNRTAVGDNATRAVDYSKYSKNGTIYNASWNMFGKFNGALSFDGNKSKIIISNPFADSYVSNFSVSLWFNTTSCSQKQRIANSGDLDAGTATRGWEVEIDTANRTVIIVNNMTSNTYKKSILVNCNNNQWTHIVLTYRDGNFSVYKNGIYELSQNTEFKYINLSGLDINIGRRYGAESQFFNGSIDEFFVYNYSLNPKQVELLYTGTLTKINSTLFMFYSNKTLENGNNNYLITLANSTSTISNLLTYIKTNNYSINVNFNSIFSQLINPFGINEHGYWFTNGTQIDKNNDGTLDSDFNYTKHRNAFLDTKMTYIRMDAAFQTNGGQPRQRNETMKWAYENNMKVLLILGTMNGLYADNTTGWCSGTSSCTPLGASNGDYSNYTNTVLLYIDRLTNNGTYANNLELECWNEPAGGTWLNNLSEFNATKFIELGKLCNATRYAVKQRYPNIPMFIGGGYTNTPLLYTTLFSNYSNEIDGVSLHTYHYPYGYKGDPDFPNYCDGLRYDLNQLRSWCSTYNVNCSRILISEINIGNTGDSSVIRGDLIKNSTGYSDLFKAQMASAFACGINDLGGNISFIPYQWSERYNYSTNSANYPEYPAKWALYTSEELGNDTSPLYYLLKQFATNHRAGDSIVNSLTDYSLLYSVASKKDNFYSTTIINADTDSVNVTLNLTGYSNNYIMDYSNGNLYQVTNSIAQIGVSDSYAVKTYGTPYLVLVEGTGLEKRNYASNELLDTTDEVWITASDDYQKRIASNISTNVVIKVNVKGCEFKSVKYTPKGYAVTNPTYTCEGNVLTFTGFINVSSESNVLDIEYSEEALATNDMCTYFTQGVGKIPGTFVTIFYIIAIVFILGFLGFMVYAVYSYQQGGLSIGMLDNLNIDSKYLYLAGSVIIGLFVLVLLIFTALMATYSICQIPM